MSRAFTNVAIFGKLRAENIGEPLLSIARLVESIGAKVLFDQATCESVGVEGFSCHSVHAIGKQADVAVVLGGDGTMLGIARELAPFRVPLIGINHGRLGFMTDICSTEWPRRWSRCCAEPTRRTAGSCSMPRYAAAARSPSMPRR
jgi:NAD+ kinase